MLSGLAGPWWKSCPPPQRPEHPHPGPCVPSPAGCRPEKGERRAGCCPKPRGQGVSVRRGAHEKLMPPCRLLIFVCFSLFARREASFISPDCHYPALNFHRAGGRAGKGRRGGGQAGPPWAGPAEGRARIPWAPRLHTELSAFLCAPPRANPAHSHLCSPRSARRRN